MTQKPKVPTPLSAQSVVQITPFGCVDSVGVFEMRRFVLWRPFGWGQGEDRVVPSEGECIAFSRNARVTFRSCCVREEERNCVEAGVDEDKDWECSIVRRFGNGVPFSDEEVAAWNAEH
jgi:hypothetical protein